MAAGQVTEPRKGRMREDILLDRHQHSSYKVREKFSKMFAICSSMFDNISYPS